MSAASGKLFISLGIIFLAYPCYNLDVQEDLHLTCDDSDALQEVTVHTDGDVCTVIIPPELRPRHPLKYRCGGKTIRIEVGGGARLCVLEELLGPGGAHSVTIFLGEGAQVEFIAKQLSDPAAHFTIMQRSHLKDGAKIHWRNVTLGGKDIEHDLESELTGANAVSEIDWMFYAKDEERYRLSARNVFVGRHGGGEITMKGVAEQKSHVTCDGMINIATGGAQTDTYLRQDVLMLDKTAKVDAIPRLEIKTNDVKASHSAAVSRVTDEDLFYFAARGIADKEAKRMFVEGFLASLVSKISDDQAKEGILTAVEGKYGNHP